MKKLLSFLMLPVAIAAGGCLQETAYVDPESSTAIVTGVSSNMKLVDGNLSGDFGPRAGFAGAATDMVGDSDRDFGSNVMISRSESSRGTGMLLLWSTTVLERMEPGTYAIEYDPGALDSTLAVNVCSGNDEAAIDYDAPAEAGSVVVTRTPAGRGFDVHTETPVRDAMGNATGQLQTSDSTFTVVN